MRVRRVALTAVVAATVILCCGAAASRTSQSSVSLDLRSTWTHLLPTLQRVDAAVHQNLLGGPLPVDVPLQYNGGPVEVSGSTSYAIFWEPAGSSVSASYHQLLQRYFTDFGGSSLDGLASQYTQAGGQPIAPVSSLGGSAVDATPFPESPLQDQDIQNEVIRVAQGHGWTGGIGNVFYVFTPSGVSSCNAGQCSFTTFCAYHGAFTANGQQFLYADMPYAGTDLAGCGAPSSPNGDMNADSEISIVSHEQMETITDPLGNAWYDLLGLEIGDKCRSSYAGASPDVVLGGHPYEVQDEYSNRALLLLGQCATS